jgi:cell wall-associated NlpC family hydrolase
MLAPDTSEIAQLIGTPFEYGARGMDKFDCYGLVKYLHERKGIRIPDYRSPSDQSRIAALMGGQLMLWESCKPEPGSVVVFKIAGLVTHCGMVLADEKFIHTWEGSGGVCVERLSDWKRRIYGFYRYIGI